MLPPLFLVPPSALRLPMLRPVQSALDDLARLFHQLRIVLERLTHHFKSFSNSHPTRYGDPLFGLFVIWRQLVGNTRQREGSRRKASGANPNNHQGHRQANTHRTAKHDHNISKQTLS